MYEIDKLQELGNQLETIKRLQLLKCFNCRYKEVCNVLERHHLKEKESRLYYIHLHNMLISDKL